MLVFPVVPVFPVAPVFAEVLFAPKILELPPEVILFPPKLSKVVP